MNNFSIKTLVKVNQENRVIVLDGRPPSHNLDWRTNHPQHQFKGVSEFKKHLSQK